LKAFSFNNQLTLPLVLWAAGLEKSGMPMLNTGTLWCLQTSISFSRLEYITCKNNQTHSCIEKSDEGKLGGVLV
jgi:hypothetical protein